MKFKVEFIMDFGDWNENRIAQWAKHQGADPKSIKVIHAPTTRDGEL
jgi:hypothetical protein